jgi:hypothetical protein
MHQTLTNDRAAERSAPHLSEGEVPHIRMWDQQSWRRSNIEPPCRLEFEPGVEADVVMVGCG